MIGQSIVAWCDEILRLLFDIKPWDAYTVPILNAHEMHAGACVFGSDLPIKFRDIVRLGCERVIPYACLYSLLFECHHKKMVWLMF